MLLRAVSHRETVAIRSVCVSETIQQATVLFLVYVVIKEQLERKRDDEGRERK